MYGLCFHYQCELYTQSHVIDNPQNPLNPCTSISFCKMLCCYQFNIALLCLTYIYIYTCKAREKEVVRFASHQIFFLKCNLFLNLKKLKTNLKNLLHFIESSQKGMFIGSANMAKCLLYFCGTFHRRVS